MYIEYTSILIIILLMTMPYNTIAEPLITYQQVFFRIGQYRANALKRL